MANVRKESPADPSSAWIGSLPGEEAYRTLVGDVTDCAIFLMDRSGSIRSWNPGAETLYGYGAAEILGRTFSTLYSPAETARGYPEQMLATAARLGRSEDEGWRQHKHRGRFWARVAVHALRDADGALYGFGEIARDLTEERRRQEALRRSERRSQALLEQALRDPLTGAFNRRELVSFLGGAVDRAAWMSASVLLLDLDGFKAINDRCGHDVGDQVLIAVAGIPAQLLRTDDRLFRMGGDEFLIYLPGVALERARTIGDRLCDAIAQAPTPVPVTVSIGAAQLETQDSVERWLQRADAAMYQAKRAGRNQVA